MKRAVLRFVVAAIVAASASAAFAQYRNDGFIGPGAGSTLPGQIDRTMQTGGG